jgi:hypothetical protein
MVAVDDHGLNILPVKVTVFGYRVFPAQFAHDGENEIDDDIVHHASGRSGFFRRRSRG